MGLVVIQDLKVRKVLKEIQVKKVIEVLLVL
jgi:hypothetical protein